MSSCNGDSKIKFAFLGDEITHWIGGIDFLRLCASGIKSVTCANELDVLLPRKELKTIFLNKAVALKRSTFSRMRIHRPASIIPSQEHLIDSLSSMGSSVNIIPCARSPQGMATAMKKRNIDCIFPCMHSLGKNFPLGWVGYIADLQHKRLPQFFGEKDCHQRDTTYQALLREARSIVVNAQNVVEDLVEFYPDHRAKIFALPFCPPLNVLEDVEDKELLSYGLPDRYFLVSNQFWVHKSHRTVFEAVAMLTRDGHDVHVVCTGNQHDYRRPQHFSELQQYVRDNGIGNKVHFLGVIPKRHQLAIMRRSIAVIQPTLFEGGPGGGAVYDAVSTGTPAIVSDIRVNKEIDIGIVEFFQAGSADSLAERMLSYMKIPPRRLTRQETLALLTERRMKMGEILLQSCSYALQSSL